jgi:hypothetical protein
MKYIPYFLAVLMIAGWGYGYFHLHQGIYIHTLLLLAALVLIFKYVKAQVPIKSKGDKD